MVTKKPWGKEKIRCKTDYYVIKEIYLNANYQCSLQYHQNKIETILVLKGKLKVFYNGEWISCINGNMLTIDPYEIHRMKGETDCVYLEVSTPELDDVVRLEDDYGRV